MERAPRPRRKVATLFLTLLAALALGLSAVAGPVAAKPAQTPPGAAKAAAPARTVTVMTRNLYLGAELDEVLGAFGNPVALVQAATQTWRTVRASDPAERMAAVADEIVAAKPHAVGLQEVTRYTTYAMPQVGSGPARVVEYDLLELLLDALAQRGMTYREVPGATANNFETPQAIPVFDDAYPVNVVGGSPQPNRAVELLDRDVIIVRSGVKTTNAQTGQFESIVTAPLPIKRGWGSVDLRAEVATFRFVNAHTEAFGGEALRQAEVAELFQAQTLITEESGALPTIYAGDYNTRAPDAAAYLDLLAGGLHDLWTQARPNATPAESNTCCQDGDLGNTVSDLTSRIDFLLGTTGIKALSADRVGDVPVNLPGDTWWASDHAGVVADVVIPRKR